VAGKDRDIATIQAKAYISLLQSFSLVISGISTLGFDMFFDPACRVLLIRFGKRLTQRFLEDMQAAVKQFVAQMGGFDGIIDLSAVEEVGDLPSQFLVRLALQKPVLSGRRRIIVASNAIAYGLSRMFSTQQGASVGEAPDVARSLQEAYDVLGIGAPDFRPVEAGQTG
jgi:hypothetical protein